MTAVLLISTLLAAGPSVNAAQFSPDIQETALRSTVKIVTTTGERVYTGTGCIVATQADAVIVVTAEHVVDTPGETIVTFYPFGPRTPKARMLDVIARNVSSDLAILHVEPPAVSPPALSIAPASAPVTTAKPPFGALTVGCSHANDPTCELVTVESLTQFRHKGATTWDWVTDKEPASGRSGGPLLSPRLEVLGICTSSVGSSGHYASLGDIRALCAKAPLNPLAPTLSRDPIQLSAQLLPRGPSRWADPTLGRCEANFQLRIDAQGPTSSAASLTAQLHIESLGNCHLVSGMRELAFLAPGTTSTEVTIQWDAAAVQQVALRLRPVEDQEAIFKQDSIDVTAAVTPATDIATTLAARVISVSTPPPPATSRSTHSARSELLRTGRPLSGLRSAMDATLHACWKRRWAAIRQRRRSQLCLCCWVPPAACRLVNWPLT